MVVSGVGEAYPRRKIIPAFIAGKDFGFSSSGVGVVVLRGRRERAVTSSPTFDGIARVGAGVSTICLFARPIAINGLLTGLVASGEHLAY